ncbi:hypothetical protein OG799_08945 [Micromonospora sp. NBC_00898]|uniref:hypothetical protein n=1 Tax=Micromonospora sp. NBC_00898 TaxID=2975981 RepID=UPI003865A9CF|nr:hypothetical protein OG799_08945 [Micromonospora sp. NBC_00898]
MDTSDWIAVAALVVSLISAATSLSQAKVSKKNLAVELDRRALDTEPMFDLRDSRN